MAVPLINGRAYDYASITIILAGLPVTSVSSISYTETQEKINNYGLGIHPNSRGHGIREASASLDIGMNDVEAIRDAIIAQNPLSSGSMLDLPAFDIIVIFGNTGQVIRTHTIKNCEFTDDGVETASGDGEVKRTFALTPSHILYR